MRIIGRDIGLAEEDLKENAKAFESKHDRVSSKTRSRLKKHRDIQEKRHKKVLLIQIVSVPLRPI
jgi:uncharacterized protein YaiI (UPF0178 family)